MKKMYRIAIGIIAAFIFSAILSTSCLHLESVAVELAEGDIPAVSNLTIVDKTKTSVKVSWETITIPESVVEYKVYRNDTYVTTTRDKQYDFTGLSSGTMYTIKVDMLDANGQIVESKQLEAVTTANTITSFTEDVTLPKDVYYIEAKEIPVGVTVTVAPGSILKMASQKTSLELYGTLLVQGTKEEPILMTKTGNYNWGSLVVKQNAKLVLDNTKLEYGDYYVSGANQPSLYSDGGDIIIKNSYINVMLRTVATNLRQPQEITIENSTLNSYSDVYNVKKITVVNNDIRNLFTIHYPNLELENIADIQNNTINYQQLGYISNEKSTLIAKNNIGKVKTALSLNLEKSNSKILEQVENNMTEGNEFVSGITLVGIPANVGNIECTKSVYAMQFDILPAGTNLIFAPGSKLLIRSIPKAIDIYGTLTINGTEEEKSTCTRDNTYGDFGSITIKSGGKLDINHTDILRGDYYSSNTYYRGIINQSGTVSIKNSVIDATVDTYQYTDSMCEQMLFENCVFKRAVYLYNSKNVTLKNNNIQNQIEVKYINLTLENQNIIENNSGITGILYQPNKLSTIIAKNNNNTIGGSIFRLKLENCNKDVFKNFENNTTTQTDNKYAISIVTLPENLGDLVTTDAIYTISSGAKLPVGTNLIFSEGSTLYLEGQHVMDIYGTLTIKGSSEKQFLVSNAGSPWYHWGNINIFSGGTLNLEYAKLENGDYSYNNTTYFSINNQGGNLNFKNSDIGVTINSNNYSSVSSKQITIENCYLSRGSRLCNTENLNIINTTLEYAASINFQNQDIPNETLIKGNTIKGYPIQFNSNKLSKITATENKNTKEDSSTILEMNVTNTNLDIFKNITGNIINRDETWRSSITITGLPENIGDLHTSNEVYTFQPKITIPKGTNLIFLDGSGVKMPYARDVLTLEGTLTVKGTQENPMLITCSSNNYWSYWGSIYISESGKLDLDYTILERADLSENNSIWRSIYNFGGTININHSTVNASISGNGNNTGVAKEVNIQNSTLTREYYITNFSNIIFKNNTLKAKVDIGYGNKDMENHTLLEGNQITMYNEFYYSPNKNSTIISQHNRNIEANAGGVMHLNLRDAKSDILKDIKENTVSEGDGRYIITFTEFGENMGDLILEPSIYTFSNKFKLPVGTNLIVDSGSTLKFNTTDTVMDLYGSLIVRGTEENPVLITSCHKDPYTYWGSINIKPGGKIDIDQAKIEKGRRGYNPIYPGIYNQGGSISIRNSDVDTDIYGSSSSDITTEELLLENCILRKSISENNISKVTIKNNTIHEAVIISNSDLLKQNEAWIEGNTITRYGITYQSNPFSRITGKNNKGINSPVFTFNLLNTNHEIFNNIENNTTEQNSSWYDMSIAQLPNNFGDLSVSKGIYSITSNTIPEGTNLILTQGSQLRFSNSEKGLDILGELTLQGTEQERILVDGYASTWGSIIVRPSGKLNAQYTDFRKVQNQRPYLYNTGGVINLNEVNSNVQILTNSNFPMTGPKTLSIQNSKIDNNIEIANLNVVNIQNCQLNEYLKINYSSGDDGEIIVSNNTLGRGIILNPGTNLIPEIKNNVANNTWPIQMQQNSEMNPNVFQRMENNTCTSYQYNGICLSGNLPNLKLYNKNDYVFMDSRILKDAILEVEAGTTCKIYRNDYIIVDGILLCNGTLENKVNITATSDGIDNVETEWGGGISIISSGQAFINHTNIRYQGYYDRYAGASIRNSGSLYLLNSEISHSYGDYYSVAYNSDNPDQVLKYNAILAPIDNPSKNYLDATYNYWGAEDGPRRYNSQTGKYEGSGTSIPNNVLGVPFLSVDVKKDITFDEIIKDQEIKKKQNYGQEGSDSATGNYSQTINDLDISIPNLDLSFNRTYNSANDQAGEFGRGWSFGLKAYIEDSVYSGNIKYVSLPNGSVNIFVKNNEGVFEGQNTRNRLVVENDRLVLITKAQSKYIFNDKQILEKIIDKYGNTVTLTVDESGNVTKLMEDSGRSYTLTYQDGRLKTITDPIQRTIQYAYNEAGMLSQVTKTKGEIIRYEYDADKFLTRILEQNDNGNLETTQTMTYFKEGENKNKIHTLTDAAGKTLTYTYNPSSNVTAITDQNGRNRVESYDAKGYVTRIVEPNNMTTQINYALTNGANLYGEIANKTDSTGLVTTYEYDARGNVTKETVAGKVKTYEYNANNSVTKQTDENNNVTTFQYAPDGISVMKEIAPDGTETTYEYTATGPKGLVSKKTDAASHSTNYEYDADGNQTKQIDALGFATTYESNRMGWKQKEISPKGYVSTYEYDNAGNMITQIVDGRTSRMSYNARGQKITETDPNAYQKQYTYNMAGKVTKMIDEAGNVTTYEYDIYGNTTSEKKPNGAIYRYEYDANNRLVKTSLQKSESETKVLEEKSYLYQSGKTTVTTKKYQNDNTYITVIEQTDEKGQVLLSQRANASLTKLYTNTGKISSETNEIGRHIYYTYDNRDRLTKKQEEIDTNTYQVTKYEYDALDNVIKESTSSQKVALHTDPSSWTVTNYTYDAVSNLIQKTTSSGEVYQYTYDSENNKIKEERKIQEDKKQITEYTYNVGKKITNQKEWVEKGSLAGNDANDTTLVSLDTNYTYDGLDRVLTETKPDGTRITYTYHPLGKEIKKETCKANKKIVEETGYDSMLNVTSKKDGNGNVVTNHYDLQNNLLQEIKPNQVVTNYEYDLVGNKIRETRPEGNAVITYTYNLLNQPITKTVTPTSGNADEAMVTQYEYDALNNMLKEETDGNITRYTYNKAGKLISKTDAAGHVSSQEWDANLNVVKEIDAKNVVTEHQYDERNNLLNTKINHVLQVQKTYNLLNKEVSMKDELDNEFVNTYDILGNVIMTQETETGYQIKIQYNANKKEVNKQDNCDLVLTYTYDMLGNKIEEKRQKADGTQLIVTKTEYDALSQVIKEIDGKGQETRYTYDGNGNVIQEENALHQITNYTYDKNGNALTQTNYLGNTTTQHYDAFDRVIEKLDAYGNRIEKLEYDTLGRQTKSIDANDSEITYTYDAVDHVIKKQDAEGNIETYEYDAKGNRTKKTDGNGNVTTYEYDVKDNLTMVTDALHHSTKYTYDNKGNLLSKKDAKQNVISYQLDKRSHEIKKTDELGKEELKEYSKNGQLSKLTTNNGAVFTYEYDVHGRMIKETLNGIDTVYTYDNNHNITQAGNMTKQYDALNRVLSATTSGDKTTYTYLDATNQVKVTDPKQNVTVETYDKVDRLSEVASQGENTRYEYNANGSLKKKQNPNNQTIYEYLKNNKVKSLTSKEANDTIITKNQYEYGQEGNTTKETDQAALEKTYTYDALNRIKTVSDGTSYTYDEVGNMLTKTLADGTIYAYTYNAKKQLTKVVAQKNLAILLETNYTYDDNGNQITETVNGKTKTNIFNERNELVEIKHDGKTIANYSYDTDGKRISKTVQQDEQVETTKYVYDGTNVILELDEQNNEKASNVYGLERIKRKAIQNVEEETPEQTVTNAQIEQNESTVTTQQILNNQQEGPTKSTKVATGYYLYNGHGDVTNVVDNNNNLLNHYDYDVFGNIQTSSETLDNPFKYAGYYYDKEADQYYLQSRYYNPAIQRFISEDTVRGKIEDPLSLNLYTYTHNNPLKYVDPDGHFAITAGTIIALAKVTTAILAVDLLATTIQQVDFSSLSASLSSILNTINEKIGMGKLYQQNTDLFKNKLIGSSNESMPLDNKNAQPNIESIPSILQNELKDRLHPLPLESQEKGSSITSIPMLNRTFKDTIIVDYPQTGYDDGNIDYYNPYGKLGGPAHKNKVKEIENDINSRGLEVNTEYRIETPGAIKGYRFADVVGLKSETVMEIHQVGKIKKNGEKVKREQLAERDINEAIKKRSNTKHKVKKETKVQFHPYN